MGVPEAVIGLEKQVNRNSNQHGGVDHRGEYLGPFESESVAVGIPLAFQFQGNVGNDDRNAVAKIVESVRNPFLSCLATFSESSRPKACRNPKSATVDKLTITPIKPMNPYPSFPRCFRRNGIITKAIAIRQPIATHPVNVLIAI